MELETLTMDAGVVRRMRSIFRKEDEKEGTPTREKTSESQWIKIRTMLMKVLGRFPEAKEAVVAGLMELTGPMETDPAWAA